MNSSSSLSLPSTLFTPPPSVPPCFVSLPDWLSPCRIFPNSSLAFRLYQRLDVTNFRHSLYLITPWETTFGSVEEVPNYNVQMSAWWLLLIFIELLLLQLTGHSDRFGGRAIAIFGYVWIWDNCRVVELPWQWPGTWALCFFTQDFAYYLGHRAVHEAGFFWGLHTIHHSSQYFNFSTALRQAAIQDAGLAIYDVLQAFFIPPPIFLVHRYFSEIFQFWVHSSVLGSLGWLGFVLNTPSHHRVHHGRNPYCIDRNYGGVLIIWDRMFGTFEAERPDERPIYGLIKPERTFNQLWLQFHTLKELLLDKWREKNLKGQSLFPGSVNKLKAVLFPPGWYPGVPVRPFFHWFSLRDHTHGVPMPECPPIVYSPPLAVWLKAYVLVHFLLLLAVFLHFEYDRLELGWPDFLLKLAFFVFTMQSFGAIFDLRPWVGYLEIFRCIGVIAYYAGRMVLERAGFRRLNHLFVVSFFALSALLWMGVLARRGWHKWQEARRRVRAVVMDEDKEKKSNNNVNERAMGEEEMAKGMYVGGGTMEWNNNGRRMDNKATIPTVDGQLQQQQGKNYY